MPADAPRFLHRTSQYGYTTDPSRSLRAEPEAVPEDYQQLLTDHAHHAERDQLAHEWSKCRDRVISSVAHFEEVTRPPTQLRSTLRVLMRTVERIDRELAR